MGVLDELKQEARAIEAEKARETTSRAEALASTRERVAPCMRAAFKYFNEFKEQLLIVNRHIEASYEIRGAGLVDGLIQGRYGVSTEDPERLDKFTFRCVCAKSGVLQVTQGDATSAAAYRDFLRANGLQGKSRDSTQRKGGVEFLVHPAVPVVVEFSADYEREAVLLRVRNLTSIGVIRHTLAPEQLDEDFLEEVAKAILRQPNRFDEITGDALSQTSKLRLKKKIQSAIRQKELADQMAQREAAEDRSISGRISRTLLRRGK